MAESIFQPQLTDISTPTYSRQGVVDTTTAQAISSAGATGIAAWQGYEDARVQGEVEGVVSEYFEDKLFEASVKEESDLPIEQRLAGAAQQTKMLAEDGFGDDDPAVKEMAGSLEKLGRAKEIGKIDELEFKARVQAAVKRGIDRMPGRADTFRKVANDVLGDNSARLGQLFAREKEEAAQRQAIQREELKTTADIAKLNGVTIHQVTQGMRTDYAIMQQSAAKLAHQKTISELSSMATAGQKEAVLEDVSDKGSAVLAIGMGQLNGFINNMQISADDTVVSLMAKGQTRSGILKEYFTNKEARLGFANGLKNQLRTLKASLFNHYNSRAMQIEGVTLADFEPYYKHQIDQFDSMIASLDEVAEDASLLGDFITNIQDYNKGSTAAMLAANPYLRSLNAVGAGSTFVKHYMQDPSLSTLPPEIRAIGLSIGASIFGNGGTNVNTQMLEGMMDTSNAVMTGEKTFDDVAQNNPQHASFVLMEAWNHVDHIKKHGFVSDSEGLNNKAKEAFVNSTRTILSSVKINQPETFKMLHKVVSDPLYMKRLSDLSPEQHERAVAGITDKYKNVINGVPGTDMGIIPRMQNAAAKIAETIMARTPTGKGEAVQAEASNLPTVQLTGLELTQKGTGQAVYPDQYRDHKLAMQELNTMLRGMYNVQSSFSKMPTYKEYVTEFYNQVFLGKGVPKEGKKQLGVLGTEQIGTTPEGRPIIQNPDGSVSTERTITVTHPSINDGKPTNIPSIYGGKSVSEQEAIKIISENKGVDPETGRKMVGYTSIEEAEEAAKKRSSSIQLK